MGRLQSGMQSLSKIWLFATEFMGDASLYARFCGVSPFQNKNKRSFYKIIIETHAIEKGLSLASPRPLFGRPKIRFIMKAVDAYDLSYSKLPVQMAYGALSAYYDLHKSLQIDDPILAEIDAFKSRLAAIPDLHADGGIRQVNELETNLDKENWINSRFSCRMFDPYVIPRQEFEQIVRTAQAAPSQCNRQSSKIYLFQDQEKIRKLLELQAGSAGFSGGVTNLAVISSDLGAWGGAQQRNQLYIDGALFSMTFLLSCHSVGLAACPLNLAVTHAVERKICELANIGRDERLIMMIALGKPMSSAPLKAARSPRRPVHEILQFEGQV